MYYVFSKSCAFIRDNVDRGTVDNLSRLIWRTARRVSLASPGTGESVQQTPNM